MERKFTRKLVMENGHEFFGSAFGANREVIAEIVFNTSMVGYQEIVSDPSYTDQAIVMTYPLIGNYGMTDEDYETKNLTADALIVREYNDFPSNFRYTRTLSEILEENGIVGISGVDTRKITRIIRDEGSQRVMLTSPEIPTEQAIKKIKDTLPPTDAVSRVSCKKRWYSRTANFEYNVVAIDCGIKLNIIRSLNKRGCNVTIVPYNTTPEEILNLFPDGLFLSNGPGDPENVTEVIETVRALKGRLPIFGICLGHQLICLACGAKTYKMKFGHRGGNHPVKKLDNGKIEITSQNHSYAVKPESLKGTGLVETHINLLDETVEGVKSEDGTMFSVQYHPESAPGPQDSGYLFDEFIALMSKGDNQ
ncbi:MAG: glutamine-hydrolyzing carbamoyl-phosphate synthase small subunit [Oscillospiraceae bacterium]